MMRVASILSASFLGVASLLWLAPLLGLASEDEAVPQAETPAVEKAGSEAGSPPPRSTGPSLGLDSLLRPRGPASLPTRPPQRGGRDQEDWQRAFAEVRAEIAELEASIAQTRREVGERSDGGIQYSPVGGEAPSDPEILKLRAQMRRDRKSLEAAKSRLRNLQVEASLAGVPEEWTVEPASAGK